MIYGFIGLVVAGVVLAFFGPMVLQWLVRRRKKAAWDRRERADRHIATEWEKAVAQRRESTAGNGLSNQERPRLP